MTYYVPEGTIIYRTQETGWPCDEWGTVQSVRAVSYDHATPVKGGDNGLDYYLFVLPKSAAPWKQFCVIKGNVQVKP